MFTAATSFTTTPSPWQQLIKHERRRGIELGLGLTPSWFSKMCFNREVLPHASSASPER